MPTPLSASVLTLSPSSNIAIGVFDGVHRGHQALLKALARFGKGSVITFSTHPRSLPLLCSVEHRIALIKAFGHEVATVDFESVKDKTADLFLDELIAKGLKCFVLGYDNHIGKGRAGTPAFIKDYLQMSGVEIVEVPPILEEGLPISSGRVRKLLETGDLHGAEYLLGRPWSLLGSPIKGDGNGKKLGFPTLNFPLEGLVMPPFGVYAALLKTPHKTFQGVANIGIAPTLKTAIAPHFEIHLFNMEDLPPPPYEVIPLSFIRPEQAFASEKLLKEAIENDKEQALKYFAQRQ